MVHHPLVKKKTVLLCSLIILFISILISCSKTTTDVSKTIPDNHRNRLQQYEGEWVSLDYKIIEQNGYAAPMGTNLELLFTDSDTAQLNIYDISSPPANRIASVETSIDLNSEGNGTFSFEDDGWGTSGEGTVQFKNNQIIVIINTKKNLTNPPADWAIFQGEKIFVKQN